jgi:hypothetical protein
MKVGAYDTACAREHAARKIFLKVLNISHNRQFSRFLFKFVWAVYGGDLTGFCQSFIKVILKS